MLKSISTVTLRGNDKTSPASPVMTDRDRIVAFKIVRFGKYPKSEEIKMPANGVPKRSVQGWPPKRPIYQLASGPLNFHAGFGDQ
jgi:hypothetical protein